MRSSSAAKYFPLLFVSVYMCLSRHDLHLLGFLGIDFSIRVNLHGCPVLEHSSHAGSRYIHLIFFL